VVEGLVILEPQSHGVEFTGVLVHGRRAQAVALVCADGPGEVDPQP
jgi:hypothetical protein